MNTNYQYKLAIYSLVIISLLIIIFSSSGINYYNKNKIPKNIYFYIVVSFLVLSVLSLILSCLLIFYNSTSHYNLILVLFISMLFISYLTIDICTILYNPTVGTTIGYILSGIITLLELGMIFFLLYN